MFPNGMDKGRNGGLTVQIETLTECDKTLEKGLA
jgi:hypothetical protein